MVRTSFQARIASVLILLLLVVVGALYFAVQAATTASIRTQVREQLDVGTGVFGQLLDVHARQLRDAVQVLTSDFGFREAVACGDEATIRSALFNHGARINAGVVMMFDMDGKLSASTLVPMSVPRADLLLIGCAQQPARDDSLYRDLGEKPGITRIVEGMLINVAGDPRIVQFFAKVDIAGLRDKLVDKFCVIAGGPCVYTGDSLEESHKGQNLSPSHFNALVENLQASMDSQGVPTPVQNRLLARLAALRGQVIEK